MKEEFIKSLDSDSEDDRRSSSKKPREGTKVEADFKGRGKWYKGKVSRDRPRRITPTTSNLTMGTRRSRRVRGSRSWAMGVGRASRSIARGLGFPETGARRRSARGDKCEAEFKNTGKFYPGTVKRERMGTAPTTLSSMTAIRGAYVRPRGSSVKALDSEPIGADPGAAARRGAACASARASRHGTGTDSALTLQLPSFTGRFRTRARSTRARSRGTRMAPSTSAVMTPCLLRRLRYDACFHHLMWSAAAVFNGLIHTDDDGESETRVEARLITALGGGSDSDRGSSVIGCAKATRSRRERYPGKIDRDRARLRRDRGDGSITYDIAYDDGERETRGSRRLIRKQRGSSRSGPVPAVRRAATCVSERA